jgi:hypothetical protein
MNDIKSVLHPSVQYSSIISVANGSSRLNTAVLPTSTGNLTLSASQTTPTDVEFSIPAQGYGAFNSSTLDFGITLSIPTITFTGAAVEATPYILASEQLSAASFIDSVAVYTNDGTELCNLKNASDYLYCAVKQRGKSYIESVAKGMMGYYDSYDNLDLTNEYSSANAVIRPTSTDAPLYVVATNTATNLTISDQVTTAQFSIPIGLIAPVMDVNSPSPLWAYSSGRNASFRVKVSFTPFERAFYLKYQSGTKTVANLTTVATLFKSTFGASYTIVNPRLSVDIVSQPESVNQMLREVLTSGKSINTTFADVKTEQKFTSQANLSDNYYISRSALSVKSLHVLAQYKYTNSMDALAQFKHAYVNPGYKSIQSQIGTTYYPSAPVQFGPKYNGTAYAFLSNTARTNTSAEGSFVNQIKPKYSGFIFGFNYDYVSPSSSLYDNSEVAMLSGLNSTATNSISLLVDRLADETLPINYVFVTITDNQLLLNSMKVTLVDNR